VRVKLPHRKRVERINAGSQGSASQKKL